MLPSRFMIVDEMSPHAVKRRVRESGGNRRNEAAVTLLPPDPYLIVEKPEHGLSPTPIVYRTTAPKSARNKEASSFVILGEAVRTPVQSRPGSPSGRVSPFRGHGFKTPTTTRPNSTAPSPSQSPRKSVKAEKIANASDRPRIARDIGLPPKSPAKSLGEKLLKGEPATEVGSVIGCGEDARAPAEPEPQANEGRAEGNEMRSESEQTEAAVGGCKSEPPNSSESVKKNKKKETAEQIPKRNLPPAPRPKPKQTPVTPHENKPFASPLPNLKVRTDKNQGIGEQQPIMKKISKPPIPAKKVGLKTSLRPEDNGNEEKKCKKEERKGKNGPNANGEKKAEEAPRAAASVGREEGTREGGSEGGGAVAGKERAAGVGEVEGGEGKANEEAKSEEKSGKKPERVVPCFQPDKCQIAPPTMASPSPITTPTISTPSTTSDLASSSIKNSQSIAAAPTTVTPSSLSSVSSTLVLTGNLARKETETRTKPAEPDLGQLVPSAPSKALSKETELPAPPGNTQHNSKMVQAAGKDSVKWSPKDSLSGEITSTSVIEAEPDLEVLSPNNLRDSPPRIPPPNMAWDEGRVPNGDVPSKVESESRFRRVVSLVWRLVSYFFCCRWWRGSRCCRGGSDEGTGKGCWLSRWNCCVGCRNPFRCCEGKICCRCCEGKGCGRTKANAGNPKSKPRKCCAKVNCTCKDCCNKVKNLCVCSREKLNSICRSLFCLNKLCCQKFLRKFKCCHKLKCCQKNGFCSCCNPNVKKETKKLNKKGSRTSSNSREKDNLDVVLVEHTSLMKAAIPVLPTCLAVFCLVLNLFVPGLGTFVSGVLCLCFGKARFSVKDTPKNRMGSFILNTIIGVAQLFTVVFCLVGWGWSVWWGVIMYKLSRRQKRLKLAEKNQKEAEGSNVNHNHVDVEQG